MSFRSLALALLFIAPPCLKAAPPTLTSLFPAGAQVGSSAIVQASGSFDPWPVEAWCSDPKIVIKAGKDRGQYEVKLQPDAKPGIAWIRLHNSAGASPLRPFIVGVLPEVAEKEPNDQPDKPQPIDRSCTVNGKLAKSGDVDVYSLRMEQGQTLVASLTANDLLRSPIDAVLQVIDANGFVLEQNHDHRGLDPQVAFTAPKAGTFGVRVFAFPSQPDSSIRHFGSDLAIYRLTLTTDGFEDYPLPLATQAGSKATVRFEGWNRERTPRVPSWITVREEPHPCFDFTAAKPQNKLVPPLTLTDRIASDSAINRYTIAAVKGKAIQVQIESRTLELPLTPVLRLLDSTGKQLSRTEPARPNMDCELSYTPTKDEVLTLELRDLYRAGGSRFVYRLRIVHPVPDFEVTAAGDRFALAPGTPLEIPLTVALRGGAQVSNYQFEAIGLPKDIKLELIQPDPKAAAKDRLPKLKLTTNTKNLSTAFRVNLIATLKNGGSITRPVRTALAEFNTTTEDLWLTVGSEAKVAPPPAKKKK